MLVGTLYRQARLPVVPWRNHLGTVYGIVEGRIDPRFSSFR